MLTNLRGMGKLRGRVVIRLLGPDGEEKERREFRNLIVNAGLAWLAGIMSGDETGAQDYCAIGTGTTGPLATDTTLQTEVARVQGTKSRVTTDTTNDTYQCVTTFAAGTGTGAITESGLLDAAAAGDLLCRQTFSVINKGADDSLEVTWKIDFD